MPERDAEVRSRVIRVFGELAEIEGRFRLTEFHVYRENFVRSFFGDGEEEFPEMTFDHPLRVGRARIEAMFEEVATERRVIVSISTVVLAEGKLVHSEAIEVSYIDTMQGEAGPDGIVPTEKLEPVLSALPRLCHALVSIINAAVNLETPSDS